MHQIIYAVGTARPYVDGKLSDSISLLIGGWIARQQVWENISDHWKAQLDRAGLMYFPYQRYLQALAIKNNPAWAYATGCDSNPLGDKTVGEMHGLLESLFLYLYAQEIAFHYSIPDKRPHSKDPVTDLINKFCNDVVQRGLSQWGTNLTLEFVFEDNHDVAWKERITALSERYTRFGGRVKGVSLKSQTEAPPLLAAELAAHRASLLIGNPRAIQNKHIRDMGIYERVMYQHFEKHLREINSKTFFPDEPDMPLGLS